MSFGALSFSIAVALNLDTCEAYGKEFCLSYSPSKSKIMTFGSQVRTPSFFVYGKELDYAREYKYLGIAVVAGRTFSTTFLRPLIRFRSSANSILNAPHLSSEPISMRLLYAMCVPHLTYASDVLPCSVRQMHSLNVALNDCIRRIFGYNRWESVRFLRLSFGYPSITDIFDARVRRFFTRLPGIANSVLRRLSVMSLHNCNS